MAYYLKTSLSDTEFYKFGSFKISNKKLKQGDWFVVEPQTIEFEILYYNSPVDRQEDMSNEIYSAIFDTEDIEYNFVKNFSVSFYSGNTLLFTGFVDKKECTVFRGEKRGKIKAYDANVFFELIKNNDEEILDFQVTFNEMTETFQDIVRGYQISSDTFNTYNNTQISLSESLQGKNIPLPINSLNPGTDSGMGVSPAPNGWYQTDVKIYKPWEYEDINGNNLFMINNVTFDSKILYLEFRQYYANAEGLFAGATYNYEQEELTVIKITDLVFEVVDHQKRQVFLDNDTFVWLGGLPNTGFNFSFFTLTPSTDYLTAPYMDQINFSSISESISFLYGNQTFSTLSNSYRLNVPDIGNSGWSITPSTNMRKEICTGDYFKNHKYGLSKSLLFDVIKRFLIQFNIIAYATKSGEIDFRDFENYTTAVMLSDSSIISVKEAYDNIDELTDLPASSGDISSLLGLLNKTIYRPILKNTKMYEVNFIINESIFVDVGYRLLNTEYNFDIFVLELEIDIESNTCKAKGLKYG